MKLELHHIYELNEGGYCWIFEQSNYYKGTLFTSLGRRDGEYYWLENGIFTGSTTDGWFSVKKYSGYTAKHIDDAVDIIQNKLIKGKECRKSDPIFKTSDITKTYIGDKSTESVNAAPLSTASVWNIVSNPHHYSFGVYPDKIVSSSFGGILSGWDYYKAPKDRRKKLLLLCK